MLLININENNNNEKCRARNPAPSQVSPAQIHSGANDTKTPPHRPNKTVRKHYCSDIGSYGEVFVSDKYVLTILPHLISPNYPKTQTIAIVIMRGGGMED